MAASVSFRNSKRALGGVSSRRKFTDPERRLPFTDRELLFYHASHDRDGDGHVTRLEFIEALTTMGVLEVQEEESERQPALPSASVRVLGAEGEGGAEREEEEEYIPESHAESYAKACSIFEAMDEDDSGGLSASEFVEAYHRYVAAPMPAAGGKKNYVGRGSASSKIIITALKWWPGAPSRGAEKKAVEFDTFADPPKTEPKQLTDLASDFMAAAGDAGAATVWLDIVGPQHHATLEWLKKHGLECATKQAFREEGVWYRGDIHHPTWSSPRKAEGSGGAGALGAPPQAPQTPAAPRSGGAPPRAWAGAILPALWLSNTPFRMGSARALGCCKRREAPPPHASGTPARHSLNWLLCGSREGTVLVTPHEAASHIPNEADAALATYWARNVKRFSSGDLIAPLDAGSGSRRELQLRSHREQAEGLVEAMVHGGEFHVVSKRHLHVRTPFFMRSLVGVFTVAAEGEGVGGGGGGGKPALLLTLRPHDDWGVVTTVLDGFRARVEGAAKYLAGRAGKASGREGREESLVRALDGPLLAAAIADSLGVRYNDLTFRMLEHWAAVLNVCVNEQPSSLHQRHMVKLQELAGRLREYAGKLVQAQGQLASGDGSSGGGDRAAGAAKRDFFDLYARRAANLEARAQRLTERVEELQEQYKCRLDEERNWMVTALTLFTAGTWPLSFLTGYFGMCVRARAGSGRGSAASSHPHSRVPPPPLSCFPPTVQELPEHGGIGPLHCGGRGGLLQRAHPGRGGRARILALLWPLLCGRDDHLPAHALLCKPLVRLLGVMACALGKCAGCGNAPCPQPAYASKH